MDKQYYEDFYRNSPTAYTLHETILDENGMPVDYKIIDCNKSYCEMMKINREALINKSFYEIFPNGWEHQEEWNNHVLDAIINKKTVQFDINRYTLQKWIRIINFPMYDNYFGCIYFDVTKEYIQSNEIEGFLKVNIDMLAVSNVEGYFVRVNEAFERILGYKVEELEGRSFSDLVHKDDLPRTIETMQDLANQKYISSFVNRVRRKDGVYRYLEWISQPNGKYIYSSARDITESRKLERELSEKNKSLAILTEELQEKNEILRKLAITDDLTGLYNRHFLDQKIIDQMDEADQTKQPISMIIVDMDFFKNVNDTWGHPVGDEVLKQTVKILKKMIRQSDLLVRLGGEEFIIICPNTTLDEASKIAERIRQNIEMYEFPVAKHLTASLGVAEKTFAENYNSWYERTDHALYKAKGTERNCVVRA